ncbi:MAG TPA: hypothetical protein VIJ42_06280, partial [Stellaceae bacterium]
AVVVGRVIGHLLGVLPAVRIPAAARCHPWNCTQPQPCYPAVGPESLSIGAALSQRVTEGLELESHLIFASPARYGAIDYWTSPSALAGLNLAPELLPPRTT